MTDASKLARAFSMRGVLVPIGVGILAIAGALVLIGPSLANLSTSVIGLGGDPYQTLWRSSAFADAFSLGTPSLPNEPMRNFGPLPWLPLHALLGEPFAYNLVWILQFPLAALASYWLGRTLGVPRGPAALAGLLTAFAPYRLAQSLGHFGAMQVFWIPLTLAALLMFLRRPSFPRALLLALSLVGTAWTEHVLFLTTLLGAAVAVLVFRREAVAVIRTRRGIILAAVLLLAVGVFGVAPFTRELAEAARTDSSFNLGMQQRLRFTPPLPALVVPPTFHLFRQASEPYGTARSSVADQTFAVGTVALLLAGMGLWRLRRERHHRTLVALGALAVMGFLLALAPQTTIGSAVLDALPVLSAVRTVNRFLALPAVAVPLLASIGVQRFPRLPAVLLGAALLMEILPAPFPTQPATIPAVYEELAGGAAGSLLEIPATTDYLVSSRAQYASIRHHRRIVASNVFERVEDPDVRAATLRVPGIGALLTVRPLNVERPSPFGQRPADVLLASLASEQVAAILVHERILGLPTIRPDAETHPEIPADEFRALHVQLRSAGLTGKPVGDGMTLYPVPPWPEARSTFVVVPGEGITTVSLRAEQPRRVRITAGATFSVRILGKWAIPLLLTARVPDVPSGTFQLRGPGGPVEAQPTANGTMRFSLGALPPGAHAFLFSIDVPAIFVENLSVGKHP